MLKQVIRINNHNASHKLSQVDLVSLDKKLNGLTGSVKLVVNYYFATANIRKSIFLSQSFVAKRLGLSRETVNRALKLLHDLGIITKVDRGWKPDRTRVKQTCYYIINKIFFYKEIRERYKTIFKALSYLVIFFNFDSIMGINPKNENKHCVEHVTGIKSSPNSLFINKNILRTGIEYLRRESLPLRSTPTTMVDNVLTIRKGEVQKSRLNNVESSQAEKVSNLNNSIAYKIEEFNEELKRQASVFPDKVILYGVDQLKGKKDLFNPATYFLGICMRKCAKDNISYVPAEKGEELPKVTLPIRTNLKHSTLNTNTPKREEQPRTLATASEIPESTLTEADKEKLRKSFKGYEVCLNETNDVRMAVSYQRSMNIMKGKHPYLFGDKSTDRQPAKSAETLCYLANNISKAITSYKPNPHISLITMIKGLFNVPYRLTGEDHEDLAKQYMNDIAQKYGLDVPFVESTEEKPMPGKDKIAAVMQAFPKTLVEELKQIDPILMPKFTPESITINEMDYDEVLD